MSRTCVTTKIPEKYKFSLKIPFKIYRFEFLDRLIDEFKDRKYRPEYFEVATLLDLCSLVYDARAEPSYWNCTPEEIADWILEDTGHPEYKEAIVKNKIDGKSVIFLEADKFPRISIKQFDIIKVLTKKIRGLCEIDEDEFKKSISLPIRRPQALYLWYKSTHTGPTAYYMTPSKFFKLIHIIPEEQAYGRSYYAVLNHWNRIPSFMPWCPHVMIGASRRINPMTGTTQRQNSHPKDHPYLLNENALRMYHFPCEFQFPSRRDSETNVLKKEHDSEILTCDKV